MENNSNQFWKHALTMGAILGVVSIVESLLMYMFNYIPSSIISGILLFVVTIAIFVIILRYAVISYRKNVMGGYITLGQAFMMGLVTIIIGTIISQLYTIIFNTFIDTQYMVHVQQVSKDTAEQLMKKQGVSDDLIQTQLSKMDERFASQTPIKSFIWGMVGGTILGAIVAFIMAAILKKDKDAIA